MSMHILLAQNSLYYPSFGGGDKSNRLLMAALAARGHRVRVLTRVAEFGAGPHGRLVRDLELRNVSCRPDHEGLQFELDGVEVRVFTRGHSLRSWISARMLEFHPEIIVTSTDDPAHVMLGTALRMERARVVYLIRAIIALPFGPASPLPSEMKSEALRHTDGSVAVSEYVAEYARRWGDLNTVHLPISLPDRTDYAELGRFDNRFVTMVNPCAGKGLSIFLALAENFSNVEFAAVPTWGTTDADLAALRSLPNVSVVSPIEDIDQIFRETRIALVPSLWEEARSRIVLEAMSRAIPVLASDVGGMAEAMLGMECLLPVNRVERYRPMVDELMVPVVDVPEQDIGPWIDALGRLLTDRAHYQDLSQRSRETALAHARSLTVLPFETYLEQVVRSPWSRLPQSPRRTADPVRQLSPERRRLVASRLKDRRKREPE
jgi:glycosyltransferase involved in cell wall biosynthesis